MIKVTIGTNLGRSSVIIDEATTLRQALEDNGIDYSVGMTSLDGSTLRAGDLDKTFEDFGITEKCYLLNVIKADNAAKVKLFGGACVVESAYPLEDIKKVSKYRPNALSLRDDNKEECFRVIAGKGLGNINKFGASFGTSPSNDSKATITMTIPEGTENAKAWAEETIGVSILYLNKVEEQIAGALDEVTAEQAAVSDCITVL